MSWEIRDIIGIGETRLQNAGCAEPRLDAEALLRHLLNYDRVKLFMSLSEQLDEKNCEEYFNLVDIRASRKPLQYIIGFTEFMGIRFKTDEGVLIPRRETETLVQIILEHMKHTAAPFGGWNILEMGVGSGAIAVSICVMNKGARVLAADVSEAALKLAAENASFSGVKSRIKFIKTDLFNKIKTRLVSGKFHLFVSNPPYIKRRLIPQLQKEISDFEPAIALDGGYDGLDFYREIAASAHKYLRKKGGLFLEIGYDQAESVTELFKTTDYYDNMKVYKDLSGNDRVFTATTRR